MLTQFNWAPFYTSPLVSGWVVDIGHWTWYPVPLIFGLCCYVKVLAVFFVYNGGFYEIFAN